MSTIRPTRPSERWLKQGEMLTRLKTLQDAKHPGTWMQHYRKNLRTEYGFADRSEQLCRQGWALWCYALDEGYRSYAEELLLESPHVNQFIDGMKRLKLVIHKRKRQAWLDAMAKRYAS